MLNLLSKAELAFLCFFQKSKKKCFLGGNEKITFDQFCDEFHKTPLSPCVHLLHPKMPKILLFKQKKTKKLVHFHTPKKCVFKNMMVNVKILQDSFFFEHTHKHTNVFCCFPALVENS